MWTTALLVLSSNIGVGVAAADRECVHMQRYFGFFKHLFIGSEVWALLNNGTLSSLQHLECRRRLLQVNEPCALLILNLVLRQFQFIDSFDTLGPICPLPCGIYLK